MSCEYAKSTWTAGPGLAARRSRIDHRHARSRPPGPRPGHRVVPGADGEPGPRPDLQRVVYHRKQGLLPELPGLRLGWDRLHKGRDLLSRKLRPVRRLAFRKYVVAGPYVFDLEPGLRANLDMEPARRRKLPLRQVRMAGERLQLGHH